MAKVSTINNRVVIEAEYRIQDFRRLLILLETLSSKHDTIVLDFSNCQGAFPASMIALCAYVKDKRQTGTKFLLELPQVAHKYRRLFINSGWANIIDPSHDAPNYSIYGRLPAQFFDSPAGQKGLVGRMLDVILKSTSGITRADLSSIEWALSEVTDNVLVHANSKIGGLAQVSIFEKSKIVEYTVCDVGLSIPRTLRATHDWIKSDTEALDQAIREGVTRDKSIGQGNGLYGSYQISKLSGGYFRIHSGLATLDFDRLNPTPRLHTESNPMTGTLIVAGINISQKDSLSQALRFQNQPYVPMDTIEYRFEEKETEDIILVLVDHVSSLGSRLAGKEFQRKLKNLYEMSPNSRIIVDFKGSGLLSSSFADEAFGKLCMEIGFVRFFRRIHFRHITHVIEEIINRAMKQRVG